jgi:hypothetical protein
LLGLVASNGEERVNRWTPGFEVALEYWGEEYYYSTDTTERIHFSEGWFTPLPNTLDVPNHDETVELFVLANDFPEAVAHPAQIRSVYKGTSGGTVRISPSGNSVLYTPPEGFVGTDRFSYRTGTLLTKSAVVTLNVTTPPEYLAMAGQWRNAQRPTDVNNDASVNALDVLLLINQMKRMGGNASKRLTPERVGAAIGSIYCDPSGDGYLSALDVLQVINAINAPQAFSPGSASLLAQGLTMTGNMTPALIRLDRALSNDRQLLADATHEPTDLIHPEESQSTESQSAESCDRLPARTKQPLSDDLLNVIAADLTSRSASQ